MTEAAPNPFRIKGVARNEAFFNRLHEIDALSRRALSGEHTLLIAPRRFGKTSLLDKVASELTGRHGVGVVTVDLFKCPTLPEFLALTAREIIRSQKTPLSKLLAALRRRLPRLAPKVLINAQGEPELSARFESNPITLQDLDDLLNWHDAVSKPKRKLLIFDEIQEISSYDPSGKTEKYLRSVIQKLENTTVFYSGSLPTLLKEMFFERKRAFYQSALLLELGLAPPAEAEKYLRSKLGRLKPPPPAEYVASLVRAGHGHPYYVQLLGYWSWEFFAEKRDWDAFSAADVIGSIFRQERTAFENAISLLTQQQRQVFRAIAQDPRKPVTSLDFLRTHGLPGHSSVRKSVQRLEALGFVLKTDSGYVPSDPLLALWWSGWD
ncbi:MAG: ATP-binding protein [Deltaproteobacteria bacterium]|nr:ATP-binding protein [Deltaproteobacteria bacterium]